MILEAIFTFGTIVLTEFIRVTATEVIRNWASSRSQKTAENNSPNTNSTNWKTAEDITEDLEAIDVEIVDLEQKEVYDKRLSRQDQERKQELEKVRSEKFKEFQERRSNEVFEEQSSNPDSFDTSIIDNDRVHVLQFHMNQVVLDKKCSACGRPMILQSRTRLDGSLYQLNDFFWSCIGFFNDVPLKCEGKQSFRRRDLGLLHKANVLEFQLSNEDLSFIFNRADVQQATIKRLKQHVKAKDDEVFCPIHHIPMTLREKKNHKGVALDMFHLKCSHPSCQQTFKLKSPAQLAAYLRRKEGAGIIG